MSVKSNSIKKKALEFVRKRDWKNAVKEYSRLAELEQNNPNIFNELGDLHLKAGEKNEAFKSYEKAIGAYKNVSLYNNAIAVCKKIMRLNPNHMDVLFTLGQLRKAQGITKEAAEYFISYMDRMILDVAFDPDEQKEKLKAIADELPAHPEILEKVSEQLIKFDSVQEAGDVLRRLKDVYRASGNQSRCEEIDRKMAAMGFEAPEPQPAAVEQAEGNAAVFERNGDLWSKNPASHGERFGSAAAHAEPSGAGAPAPLRPRGSASVSAADYGNLDLDRQHRVSPAHVGVEMIDEEPKKPQAEDERPDKETAPVADEAVAGSRSADAQEPDEDTNTPESMAGLDSSDAGTIIVSKSDGPGAVVHVSKIIDEFRDEVRGAIDSEDYHTHYDLGMAYLEMDLLSEAVREFQLASKAPEFQVSSLEMIGLCFIKQNQPHLAVKQLERGLSLIGSSGRESLGLLYTLGVAFEMMGDDARAKGYFEDVYVVDVAFRNVAEKIKKYSSL